MGSVLAARVRYPRAMGTLPMPPWVNHSAFLLRYRAIHDVISHHGLEVAKSQRERPRTPTRIERDATTVREIQAGAHAANLAEQHSLPQTRIFQIAEMNEIDREDIFRLKVK